MKSSPTTSYLDVLTQSTRCISIIPPTYYISGPKGCIISQNHIKSSYRPAGLEKALDYLKNIQLNSAQPLYLVCPKYYPQKGNDVKAGISETAHHGETPLETVYRGVLEEAQIKLDVNKQPLYHFSAQHGDKNIEHYIFHLDSMSDYVHSEPPEPEVWKDDKNSKVMVYMIGTYPLVSPILESFKPFPLSKDNKKKKIDPISNLVLAPLYNLDTFLYQPLKKSAQCLKFISV